MITPEQVREAIAIIEHSRGTHVQWADYIEHYPEHARQPRPEIDTAGDVVHHRRCINGYDQVLGVLREVLAALP